MPSAIHLRNLFLIRNTLSPSVWKNLSRNNEADAHAAADQQENFLNEVDFGVESIGVTLFFIAQNTDRLCFGKIKQGLRSNLDQYQVLLRCIRAASAKQRISFGQALTAKISRAIEFGKVHLENGHLSVSTSIFKVAQTRVHFGSRSCPDSQWMRLLRTTRNTRR